MPKYVIERAIDGSDAFTADQLQSIAKKSCNVLTDMGPQIQWVLSYVTAGKWYCVYIAPDEETVREHAKRGGFPADSVAEVVTIVDPVNAEEVAVDC